MAVRSLLESQKRSAFLSRLRKRVTHRFRDNRESRPVFILGRQRSGTSMLMYALHLHPDTVVHDEHRNSRVFLDYRIRNLDAVHAAIAAARTPVVCFKPICDSHRIHEFLPAFPDARVVWAYRHYQAASLSALRKFANPVRAVRLACTGRTGGGWFQEGLSAETRRTLRAIYSDRLEPLDLCCLAWWARNRILLEGEHGRHPGVTLVKYEHLGTAAPEVFAWLFRRIGLREYPPCARHIRPAATTPPSRPELAGEVRALCEQVLRQLDDQYRVQRLSNPAGSAPATGVPPAADSVFPAGR